MDPKSILLVDDEQIILDSLFNELDGSDFKVTLAASGEEGIAKINEGSFDLVVSDLSMPGFDGFQVLKAAKRRNLQTMTIILTGYADLQASVDALRLGADDFLQKPCDVDELLYRMSNCFVKLDMQRKIAFYEKILPVCCYCKKIRDDQQGEHGKGNWYNLEEYLYTAKGVSVSHGCCPDCFVEQMHNVLPL